MAVNFVKLEGSGNEEEDKKRAKAMYMRAAVPVLGRIAGTLNVPRSKVMEWAAVGGWQREREERGSNWRERIGRAEAQDYEKLKLAGQLAVDKLIKRIEQAPMDAQEHHQTACSLVKYAELYATVYAKLKRRAGMDKEADEDEAEL